MDLKSLKKDLKLLFGKKNAYASFFRESRLVMSGKRMAFPAFFVDSLAKNYFSTRF